MLGLFALAASLTYVAAASAEVQRSCEPCEPSLCKPLPAGGCKFGIVSDSCGCCSACAAGEGENCAGRGSAYPRCAPGLECKKSDKGKRSKLGVCVCKSNYEVCGSDGATYSTGCDLKAASLKAQSDKLPEIKVQHKGKCYQAPIIVTAPGEIWNVTGSQVYLSCEAIGVPTPVLTWRKVSVNNGKTEMLPGDRENLAVQTRGGPEKHEVTGWVLVSPLTPADAGSYECHVANAKGETSAAGGIHVVKSLDDIPTKKAKDDEL
ncbi:insulin-like growth factor-binding protein 7 [Brienomyrus brachyistius]|uniref:insulin-like growth factor-binding protein 7 n=1 Tax=Brienomyrus brachyistius TaxID=42636 RepID=UPI0020B30A3A|nr:insulin-like growth factor-binding protein 7 [Brienomyrus brachyistius]